MISIVIPVYNVVSYLNKCLDSIINQEYKDWECILIDDGSTDGSGIICDQYSKISKQIKVIHQINQGVSIARNKGMSYAKGDYITFIDSDDWVDNTYLSDLVKGLNKNTEIVVSGIIQEFPDNKQITFSLPDNICFSIKTENTNIFVKMNEKSLLYGPVAKLYKRSIIQKYNILFPKKCSYGEDLIFNYQYLNYINTITYIACSNYHYRIIGSGTLSSSFRPEQFEIDYSQWKLLKSFYQKKGIWNNLSQIYLYQKLWGIIYDGIFFYPKNTNKQYLRQILSIPEINDIRKYKKAFICSRWIKFFILYRCHNSFSLYFKLHKLWN